MNQIREAATGVASPVRKLNQNYNRAASESPKTPSANKDSRRSVSGRHAGKENENPDAGSIGVVGNNALTPMKRVPILANFEEWMKMATDNKINAANSWSFALIDYFHDMSLLKEGDGVNFQKASCTLDGCVKIYTSRVDSVATETGKLLSGLADSGDKKKQKGGDDEGGEEEEDEDEEEGEDGVKKKTKKRSQRAHEATLAPSFASLQLKKLELEFAVDPLFKKASADFDEGGAKGLLLNHLAIDSEGRIVFDSSDDAADATAMEASKLEAHDETAEAEEREMEDMEPTSKQDEDFDLGPLAAQFFPDLSLLDTQDVCPSLKNFSMGDGSGELDIPFLKAPEDWRQDRNEGAIGDRSGMIIDDDNAAGFDDDDDGILGGFDLPPDTGFGEGGEAWAKDAALEPMLRVHRMEDGELDPDGQDGVAVGDFDPANPSDPYAVSINHRRAGDEHENILSYFDNALRAHKTWAGPEHWRIKRIKDASSNATQQAPRPRKEKEPFEINFLAPMDQSLADMICTTASSNSAISMPKTQWKTKGRNLLPDDKHFSSRSLLSLFLKPKARLGSRQMVRGLPVRGSGQAVDSQQFQNGDVDPAYWASQKGLDEAGQEAPPGEYDANFFADDDGLPFSGGIQDDDDDGILPPFADAQETILPPDAGTIDPSQPTSDPQSQNPNLLPGSFGTQLVTQGGRRLRPEYVNYARVAKKVDIRKLKENMWEGMSSSLVASIDSANHRLPTPAPSTDGDVDMMDVDDPEPRKEQDEPETILKFTDMMQGLRKVYPEQQMKDISTSFCFICLLHLANEKGLVLQGEGESLDHSSTTADGRPQTASSIDRPLSGRGGMQEIFVRKDVTVGKDYEGE